MVMHRGAGHVRCMISTRWFDLPAPCLFGLFALACGGPPPPDAADSGDPMPGDASSPLMDAGPSPLDAGSETGPSPACRMGTPCRPSTGPCDAAEYCDMSGVCPRDELETSFTVCRAAA